MKNEYSKFFNLELNPFGETPDPDFYYASVQHNRALGDLDQAVRQGKGFCLLTGEVGTGKTLLARLLLTSLGHEWNTALVLFPKFTEIELLQAICEEFEVPSAEAELKTVKSYVDHLNKFLITSIESGKRSVLIIDEAQALSVSALETIRLLTNLETRTQKLLQIVLVGQPELNTTLEKPELRQLKQRIGTHAALRGLDALETERYIKSRIEQVGNGNFIRFETLAVKLIHQHSAGVPRLINQIAEKILQTAELKRVRLMSLEFVSQTLGIEFKKPKAAHFLSFFREKRSER